MKRRGKGVDVDAAHDALLADILRDGAVRASRLRALKLDAGQEARLIERLARAGIERTGTHLRRPLEAQLGEALERAGPLAVARLRKAVVGASSAADVAAAVDALLREGAARLLIVGGVECLAPPSAPAMSAGALAVLERALPATQAALRLRKKKGRHARALGAGAVAPLDPERWLLVVMRALPEPLVFVPDLARRVAAACPLPALHALLLGSPEVELRPESGVGGLSAEDAALCPRDAAGHPLSYARLVRGA